MNRRQALTGVMNFVFISCLAEDSGRNETSTPTDSPSPKPDLTLVNLRDSDVTVNISIGSFEQTVTLSPKDTDGSSVSCEDVPEMVEGAIVDLSIQDGSTGTYELNQDMNEYRGLTVVLDPSEIRFAGGKAPPGDE